VRFNFSRRLKFRNDYSYFDRDENYTKIVKKIGAEKVINKKKLKD